MTLFQAADSYLKAHLNGREKIPLSTWKAEQEKLIAEKNRLNQGYIALKGEIKEAEQIRRSVYDIMRSEARGNQRTRAQDVER